MLDLQRLKGRILVKGKKSEDSRILSDREEEDEEEDEEEGAGAIEQRPRVSGPARVGQCGVGLGDRWPREGGWEDLGAGAGGWGQSPAEACLPGQADLPGAVGAGRVLLCHAPADPAPRPGSTPALPRQLPQRAPGQEAQPRGRWEPGCGASEAGGRWGLALRVPGDSGWVGDADVDLERRVKGLWGQ